MTVIGYLRVSTEEQAESGLGLEAQRFALQQFVQKIGMTISQIFTDEGLSGSLPMSKRPGLMAATNALKKDSILLVAKRDRLARDLEAIIAIQKFVNQKKSRIVSAAGEGTETDTASSKLVRNMLDVISEHERDIIRERTKLALHAKKLRKERVGHIPFGFKLDTHCTQCSKEKEEHLVVDQEEQKIIQEMLRLKTDKLSVRKIADILNKNLFLNRDNALWHHMSIHRVMKGIESHKCLLEK